MTDEQDPWGEDGSDPVLPAPPDRESAEEPVRRIPGDAEPGQEELSGVALCLSGGGFRAMLFHLGVLWRLNEAGWLPRLDRISSVSGGSITAAVLGMAWSRLRLDAGGVAAGFLDEVVVPVMRMARQDVDVGAVVTGGLLPGVSVSDRVTAAYRHHLFGEATLQDLPERPRFVINATNLESAVLFRFSRPYLADYRVGRVRNPDLSLAVAVAASSAFPPFLSPCLLDLEEAVWEDQPGNDLGSPEFRGRISLSDGGVYDNLGLETAWKRHRTILVSDAGGIVAPDASPPGDWARQLLRVLRVVDGQVRALRRQQVIDGFRAGTRDGVYLGIRSQVAHYPVTDPIPVAPEVVARLAGVPTRLAQIEEEVAQALVNWGYAVADTGLRAHVEPAVPRGVLPFPRAPLTGGGVR